MDTPQNEVIVEEELGQDFNPEDKDIVFMTMTVRVTATMSHRTVFIIVIKKEEKQFFSFKAISDFKIF